MTAKNSKKIAQVNEFPCDLMERTEDGMDVVVVGSHTYYNLDGKEKMSEWVRGGKLPKCIKSVCTTNGTFTISSKSESARGTICDGSLGYFYTAGNGIDKNAQSVGLFSLPFSNANGFNILPENFDRVVSGFAARRLIEDNVWNHQDAYSAPNIKHQKYAEWNSDAYVFSLFESKSNQTSIKGTVDGESYDFVNQFYPFTKSETYDMCGLTKKKNFKDESRWCKQNGKFDNLSSEAVAVLEAFRTCIIKSASDRDEFDKKNPEIQVKRWDAGYKQLKDLFAKACPTESENLKEKVNALKAKMLPLVYELGFLRA